MARAPYRNGAGPSAHFRSHYYGHPSAGHHYDNSWRIVQHPQQNQDELVRRLRGDIEEMRTELALANTKIQELTADGYWPKPDYPRAEAHSHANGWRNSSKVHKSNLKQPNSDGGESSVVKRYARLFSVDRPQVMAELNELADLAGQQELQLKIVFTVVALAFRSVNESMDEKRRKVFETLDIDKSKFDSASAQFETALYRFLYRQAKMDCGMITAKLLQEVTARIWKALFDFSALKKCSRFNQFVVDCVDVVWDLVAGVEGALPRYRLEFECGQFASDRHLRFHSSSLRSQTVKRFVWPTLLSAEQGELIQKGVVIT